jgi:hypothetical protein
VQKKISHAKAQRRNEKTSGIEALSVAPLRLCVRKVF